MNPPPFGYYLVPYVQQQCSPLCTLQACQLLRIRLLYLFRLKKNCGENKIAAFLLQKIEGEREGPRTKHEGCRPTGITYAAALVMIYITLLYHHHQPENQPENHTFHLAENSLRGVGTPVARHPHVEHGCLALRVARVGKGEGRGGGGTSGRHRQQQ